MEQKYDLSVIVTAHNEGTLAHHTMKSLFRSVDYAKEHGINIEIIAVLDKPDKETEEYFSRYNNHILVEKVDFGDLGLSRNFGINASSGKYISILDADDLFGENWLLELFKNLEQNNKTIAHPEYNVVFGEKNLIWKHISSLDEDFYVGNLIENNYWSSLCGALREIFISFPYKSTGQTSIFGFEDWHFNCETLANSINHIIIPGTLHFIRKKNTGSLLSDTVKTNRILRKTLLFEPEILTKMLEEEKKSRTLVYYPFNGNTNDESGNNNHAVAHGATLTVNRFNHHNKAYYFNGHNSYITAKLEKKPGNKYISVSVWVNFESFLEENPLIYIMSNKTLSPQYFYLSILNSDEQYNEFLIGILDKKGQWGRYYLGNIEKLEVNRWYHIVAVIDTVGGNIKSYLNNSLIVNFAIDKGDITGIVEELWIGATPDNKYFNGTIDEVRIYNSSYRYE